MDRQHTADFAPNLEMVDKVEPVRTAREIADETMLFSASPRFAAAEGGPITQEILAAIDRRIACAPVDPAYPHVVIDTRVHMLMPGMWPAIPGWHCDNTPRGSYAGQPDPRKASHQQINYTVLVATERGLSRTEFVADPLSDLPYDPARVWGSINAAVENLQWKPHVIAAREGHILRFSGITLHRATPATARGWRYFFRLSFMQTPPQDEIRRQVQVYVSPDTGW